MAQSTAAVLIGIYGLIRGLLGLLLGIGAVLGGALIGAAGSAVGSGAAAGTGGLVMVMGLLLIIGSVVMWASSIGLFMEKSWAPLLTFLAYGLMVLSGVLGIVSSGDIGIFTIALLALDLAATGWGAMNAPQIPVGNQGQQAHAV